MHQWSVKTQKHMTMVTMRHVRHNEMLKRREHLQIAVWRFGPSGRAGSMHIHTPSALPKHNTKQSPVSSQYKRRECKVCRVVQKEHKPSTGPRPASSIPMRQGSSFQAGDVEAITMPQQHFTTSCGFVEMQLYCHRSRNSMTIISKYLIEPLGSLRISSSKRDSLRLGHLGSFGYGGTELSFSATEREGRWMNISWMDDNIMDIWKVLHTL